MAQPAPIYDPDDKQAITRPKLKVLEGGGKTSPPTGNLASAPEPEEDRSRHLRPVPDQIGKGYTGRGEEISGLRARLKTRRKLLLGLGAGGVVTLLVLGGLFGLLNVFKLDHIMSNIDQKALSRHSAASDKMSSKMLTEYILLRLAENEDPNIKDGSKRENLILRAKSVDNNNPFFDWYRTMRASSFEDELFEKHGIKFVSVMEKGKTRKAAVIKINDKVEMSDEILKKVEQAIGGKIDLKAINNELRAFVQLEIFQKRTDFRKALVAATDDLTRKNQVMKRRFVRLAITNMIGVKSWRFFSDVRDNVDQKKLDIRLKLYEAVVPDFIKEGKLVRCITGLDSCRPSRDVNDPQNKKLAAGVAGTSSAKDKDKPDLEDTAERQQDGKLNPDTSERLKGIGKILQAANVFTKAINVVANLDMLSYVHNNLQSLAKFATVAKGAQVMGLYQVLETSRDQIKSGNVNPVELNALMMSLNNIASSDGWTKVINGQGDPSQPTNPELCTQEHKAQLEKNPDLDKDKYAPLCPDQRIGDASKAQERQDDYNNSVGQVVGPIVNVWDGANASWFSPFISVARAIFDKLNVVVNKVTESILNALGLGDDLKHLMFWAFGQVMDFFGIGPIPIKQASGGQLANYAIQGSAYTAETTARNQGAALTTEKSRAAAEITLREYNQAQYDQTSISDRLFSLSNHKSVTSKAVFAISDLKSSSFTAIVSSLGSMFKSALTIFMLPFSHQAAAETNDDGYRAAEFAGIETYDFPPQCYSFDPITSTPLAPEATNVLDVLANPARYGIANTEPITISPEDMVVLNSWDTVRNSDVFYDTIYKIIGNQKKADDIAVQIYNCYLLQNAVLGSLGFLHGYTNDHGLEDSSVNPVIETTSNTSSSGVVGNIGESSEDIACAPGTRDIGVTTSQYTGEFKVGNDDLNIRLCQVLDIRGEGNNIVGTEINGGAIVNSRVSGAWAALGKKAKIDGVTLTSYSSFRLADSCGGTGDGDACARPGQSPHQLGVAVDFTATHVKGSSTTSCSGRARDPGNQAWEWLYKNAESFGIKQYSFESWHWDLLPISNRCGTAQ
ncbi:D-alanyl-D-alanine carboxypeptidase family protein [Candidatus Saccharibacteria bacterium]|nr:D-alanyl-D-alanine carboxypeptidase family protein [Candidatus Saccharibacteria bacterium]